MTRRSQLVISVAFVLAMLVPFVAVVTRITDPKALENRPLTSFPRPSLSKLFDPKVYGQLATYLVDRLPWRDRAIAQRERLSVSLFAESAGDQVVVGADGWRYLAEIVNKPCYTADQFDGVRANLAELAGLFAAEGMGFRLLVPPQKETVYPEHLPSRDRQRSCIAANSAGLQAAAAGTSPGYSSLLTATRTGPDLYYRADTHWNDRGVIIGARELVESLQAGVFEGSAYTITPSGRVRRDDLLQIEGTPGTEIADRADLDRPGVVVTTSDAAGSSPTSEVFHEQRSGAPLVRGRVVIVHDSFGIDLLPLTSGWFADATWFAVNRGYEPDRLAKAFENADSVVLVLTERHLVELLGGLVDVARSVPRR